MFKRINRKVKRAYNPYLLFLILIILLLAENKLFYYKFKAQQLELFYEIFTIYYN